MTPEPTFEPPFAEKPVLVVGATGYIGARLVPRLLAAGYTVRCLARSPRKLASRPWSGDPGVTIVEGDLEKSDDLPSLIQGCGAAFYLVHSMASAGGDYAGHDTEAATRFADAAASAGIARIIYLGGPRPGGGASSRHPSSRKDVGRILAAGGVPVTIFHAAIIIGSGSASFEILRYLVDRQPLILTPKWTRAASQPIAVRNVLHYLVACLAEPLTVGQEFDIGGPDVLSYADLMRIMAEERKLPRRLAIPVPAVAVGPSALWINLVTPVSRDMARQLAEGLRYPVVCSDSEAALLMPQPLLTAREAIRVALERVEQSQVESSWSAAGAVPGDPEWVGGKVFIDRREALIDASPDDVFRAVCRIGGTHGWYVGGWLWKIRGWLDSLAGGPGLQRGRRDPEQLYYGEAVDFWRVTAVDPGRHLRLRAEMKLPGEALLEFSMEPAPQEGTVGTSSACRRCRLVQTARFWPRGLAGLAYWYSLMPVHPWLFAGMIRGIKMAAERAARSLSARRQGGAHQNT